MSYTLSYDLIKIGTYLITNIFIFHFLITLTMIEISQIPDLIKSLIVGETIRLFTNSKPIRDSKNRVIPSHNSFWCDASNSTHDTPIEVTITNFRIGTVGNYADKSIACFLTFIYNGNTIELPAPYITYPTFPL